MAAIKSYAVFKDQPPVDGLCPKCFNPALKTAVLQRIDWDGITQLGERIYCRDCHVWTGPIKEYPHD